jgi:hypothetical protein
LRFSDIQYDSHSNGCHIEWQIRSFHLWRLPNYHFYNVSLQMVKKILIVTPPLIQHILNGQNVYN